MNLKTLSDEQLIARTRNHVALEKASTIEVVKDFQEIFERRTYLKYGHSSLFIMAIKEFGYCPGSAQLRINAMRLVRDMPEVEQQIQSGELQLTAASEIQSFLYSQQRSDKGYSPEQKAELIGTCLNKSLDDVRNEFADRDPEREKKDSVRKTRKGRVRASLSLSSETEKKVKRIKALWSHVDPNMPWGDLIDRMCEITLDKIDPVRRAKRAAARKDKGAGLAKQRSRRVAHQAQDQVTAEIHSVPEKDSVHVSDATCDATSDFTPGATIFRDAAEESELISTHELLTNPDAVSAADQTKNRTRYIKAQDAHTVALENSDEGCEFVSEVTGERCGSYHQLQRDHIVEFAFGGSNEARNLRMYCAQHNRARGPSYVRARGVRYAG